MKIELTNEEIEAIKYYKENIFNNVNQLLVTDSRSDIAFLSDEQNEGIDLKYDRMSVMACIETIKLVYSAMVKTYYSNPFRKDWCFSKIVTFNDIQKYKNEPYIDNFLIANLKKNEDNSKIRENAIVYIYGDIEIPYMNLNKVFENSDEILISLFTEIKEIEDISKSSNVHEYKLNLVRQELQELTEEERNNLYDNILSNSDLVNNMLNDTISLEKENVSNYESIRELEKQVSDFEMEINRKEMNGNYGDSERNADNIDYKELKDKLEIFKNHSAEIFDTIKSNNRFITEWKKDITVYLMAECNFIQNEIINSVKNSTNAETEKKESSLDNNSIDLDVKNIKDIDSKDEIGNIEDIEVPKTSFKLDRGILEKSSFETISDQVSSECKENLETTQKLIENINKLIAKQQNFAKIAGNLGATYSALNNAFEMKKNAEILENLINTMLLKILEIKETQNNPTGSKKLLKIDEVNNQIGILLNYLNNPKTLVAKTKLNRFDEMLVVEENELKRGIAKAILNIRGEAELKKLRDDTQIIEEKSPLMKFLGIFTGQNKLDEFILDQIELRQSSIKRTLSKKLRLDYNYSIHELIAEIRMFIKDNEDDELVAEDIKELQEFEKEIAQNFVIIESKVQDIIVEKESKNLPVENKITKKQLIEIETYRFLNKYGYDIENNVEPEEVTYVDTTAKEISRIIDYINTSSVLE